MSNTQYSQDNNERPLAERSSIEIKTTIDEVNRVIRYRDNLRLIPETMEYDEQGRKVRGEIKRCEEYIWKYQNGFLV